MKNLNLLALASEITKESTTKSSAKKSISDYLVEILYDEKLKLPKDGTNENPGLRARIAVRRIEAKYEASELSEMNADEIKKLMNSEMTTVGNGIDTAVCDGKTNASFGFNPKYEKYNLIKHSDKSFSIELK